MPSGAGLAIPWRRCVFCPGTCTAKQASTRSNGAGLNPFSTPAPTTISICADYNLHLLLKHSMLILQIHRPILKFRRTWISPSLHIFSPHVLLPPFRKREKHADVPRSPCREVERALDSEVEKPRQAVRWTTREIYNGEKLMWMYHGRPVKRLSVRSILMWTVAPDGGGAPAPCGFQRARTGSGRRLTANSLS